jgi:hypothetical protein
MRQAGNGSAFDSRALECAVAAGAALLAADGIHAVLRPLRVIVALLLGV